MVGRSRRRRGVGPRRARHEGPGRGERRRVRVARARGLRAGGRSPLHRDADEEVGGDDGYGLVWLCAEHPDAARCDYAINEGGGERLVLGGDPVYLCATAEKMSAPFTVRVHGRSGHASMPGIADNALVKSARYLEALGAYEPPRELIPEAKGLLEALLGEAPPLEEALARARGRAPDAAGARRAAPRVHALADDDRRVAPAET